LILRLGTVQSQVKKDWQQKRKGGQTVAGGKGFAKIRLYRVTRSYNARLMAALQLRAATLASTTFLIPPLSSLLPEWLLRAVPKKKVSHSRKSMRSANKGLHEKTNISTCASCGLAKRAHHFCPNCYSTITRRWKSDAKPRPEPVEEPVVEEEEAPSMWTAVFGRKKKKIEG